jgi:hypothetical protein
MAKLSTYTALTGANFATGDKFVLVDASAGTAGTVTATMAEMVKGLPRLGFNPPTTGIMAINGTTQWNWDDGAIFPETDDDVDLGKSAQQFKDGYFDGTLFCDAFDLNGTGVTATGAELNYLDITTLGTGAASKAVVLDAGEDYTWPATGVLTYGVLNDGTTALAATALELNRTCDVSTRVVAAGATLSVTVALHDGKIIALDTLAGSVCTLPVATGSGARFEFITKVLATSNSHVIKVADASGLMAGVITTGDNADGTATAFATVADSDTITLNRTTTGSVRIGGDRITLVDIATNVYAVSGNCIGTGGEATPFSASV